jgi:hypothetical protein
MSANAEKYYTPDAQVAPASPESDAMHLGFWMK